MTRTTRTRRHAALALGTVAAARPRCEPVEVEDTTNAALELIEAHVRDVLRAGGEHALMMRLSRLLPGNVVVDGRLGGAAGSERAGDCAPSPARVGSSGGKEGAHHG
ncbi:MAG: hypothetical protein CTY28_15950 [Hyphomicrobium sp.]|nr:MAG: hypothetical protein CTY28_15950 [Hyphomicrobium sp.]